MNGIVNKLTEIGIDLSADNIYEIHIFNSRYSKSVYNTCILDKSKLVLVAGYDSSAYYYWGMGIFDVDKVNRATTKISFEEYHKEPVQETVRSIDIQGDDMKAINSRGDYMLACAIFLKS